MKTKINRKKCQNEGNVYKEKGTEVKKQLR